MDPEDIYYLLKALQPHLNHRSWCAGSGFCTCHLIRLQDEVEREIDRIEDIFDELEKQKEKEKKEEAVQ